MAKALPTRSDYFNVGAAEIFSRSAARPATTRITPEEVFTEGSDINIVNASASAMADEATRRLCRNLGGLFLDSAEGEDLDRLVNDRFSPTVVRKGASAAIVTLAYRRSGDLSAGIVEGAGKKVRTQRGTEFELLQTVIIPIGSTGPAYGLAQATQTGTTGNVAADTITQFVDAPSDPSVTVNNPADGTSGPASGGDDRETDARLRERARQFFNTARRGTLSSIEFGALTVEGVRSAQVIESKDENGDPTGIVQLFIADSNGQANQALADTVTDALGAYRAVGIIVDVFPSTPQFEQIVYSLVFEGAGVDTTAAAAQLATITISAINDLAPGSSLQVSLLYELARSIPGLIVDQGTVVTPAGDIIPATGATIRTSADRVETTARSAT